MVSSLCPVLEFIQKSFTLSASCQAHAQWNDESQVLVLQVDNFLILLDCGWNDSFDPALLDNVKRYGELARWFCAGAGYSLS